jgi:hypothetical protein
MRGNPARYGINTRIFYATYICDRLLSTSGKTCRVLCMYIMNLKISTKTTDGMCRVAARINWKDRCVKDQIDISSSLINKWCAESEKERGQR